VQGRRRSRLLPEIMHPLVLDLKGVPDPGGAHGARSRAEVMEEGRRESRVTSSATMIEVPRAGAAWPTRSPRRRKFLQLRHETI